MTGNLLLWVLFGCIVLIVLFVDLFVLHKKPHVLQFKEAAFWSGVWILLAVLFNIGVFYFLGSEKALKFTVGYLIELSLSVDNLFVFLIIFSYFQVPPVYQHRVLFWGILGAIIMRGIMITAGVALITAFHWIIYVFGAFLIITGIKLAFGNDTKIDPEKSPVLRICRRIIPFTDHYDGSRFFTKRDGRRVATLLFLVLLTIELTDVVFAIDSIPAILAVTTDLFIVFTSNIFAIMGLRSFYFALAAFMQLFQFLHYGLAVILSFVGVKMLISSFVEIPIFVSLGVVIGVLAISVLASLLVKQTTPSSPSK